MEWIEQHAPRRLIIELREYFTEVEVNRAKIEQMRMEGADEYDIKKYGEVLDESEMMVPDSQRRLKQFTRQLRETVEDIEDQTSVKGSKALEEARTILAEVDAGIRPESAAPSAAPAPSGAAVGGGGGSSSTDASTAAKKDPAPSTGATAASEAHASASQGAAEGGEDEDDIGEEEM